MRRRETNIAFGGAFAALALPAAARERAMTHDLKTGGDRGYLQAVFTRMAANSFLARGWSVTLTVALIGLATDRGRPMLTLLALFPIAAFWLFDAYFLALEKRFRELFDTAARAALSGGETTLSMNPGPIAIPFVLRCATRPVMLLSHGTILACDLGLLAILCAVG